MGETLVFATPSVPLHSTKDILANQTIAHLGAPAALTAARSANKVDMSNPVQAQHSPIRERRTIDFAPPTRQASDPSQSQLDTFFQKPSIILRKLPRNTGQEGIRNLLLFAKDLVAVKLVDSLPEDTGFATAVAQFQTLASAREAKESLDGKPNATQDARLIVELPNNGSPTDTAARLASRRSTIDTTAQRSAGPLSAAPGQEQRSRFSAAFEKISPPLVTPAQVNGDFPAPQSDAHLQALFSPKSPMGNDFNENQRNFGKSMINDDAADDETDGLIRDPLAYVRDGRPSTNGHKPVLPQLPTAQFSSFSLNDTGPLSPSHAGLVSPSAGQQHAAPFSQKLGQHNGFNPNLSQGPAGRTSYPPANPADQNPPCNTLYVGNLPNNTSEDELKRLFSQQRGYKRLCFRTKQNGPMCFVEFESITLATQALHHLYGKMLSNSVKGGIRLSFSKNPLGVRNGQVGIAPSALGGPHGGYANNNFGAGDMISPPPGFASPSNGAAPPGLPSGPRGSTGGPPYGRSHSGEPLSPVYQAHQYSMSGAPFASQLRMAPSSLYAPQGMPPGSTGFVPPYYDSAAR